MTVAIRDAYRTIVVTTGTNSGGIPGVSTANSPASTFQLDGGFGISLVYDNVNNKVTIVNTGNGTGALTTITEQESLGTYYPIFSRAPTAGDINGVTGTYQLDTMYIEQTARPLTYNPGIGMLSCVGLTLSGTLTVGSATLIGSAASLTRFPNAIAVISNTAAGIQQNETHNIGLMAEGTANSSNTSIYGVGVYGVGYTAGATRSGGVIGEGHVSATGDTGSAIGVRGYANDTHAGGYNIGLYGDATNGSSNYALYLNNGGIYSAGALSWTLNGNLTFSGAYTVTIPTLNLTNALGVSYGGTGTGTAGITAFNNITGYTASGATGTTSTNLVFSTSPTITTPTISGHFTAEGVTTTGATGTGNLVFSASPTLATPTLGVATATSINKMAITAPASSSTLAVADGKTFTVSNTITLAGTDSTTITLPATTGTVPLNNQTMYIGTTSIAINRASANLALTGISSVAFPGSTSGTATVQATATAGTPTLSLPITTGTLIGTGDTGTVSNTMLANSSVTFGTTAVSLGSTSTSIAGLTSIDGAAGLTSAFATPNGTIAIFGAATSLTIGNSATTLNLANGIAGTVNANLFTASAGTSTINFSTGSTSTGNTKTINIGTGGQTGSTTAITIGSTAGTSSTQANGKLLAAQSTAQVGYATGTGAGGSAAQTVSRTGGVTASYITGAITLFAAAPTVGTYVTFTVTNTTVAATDTVIINFKSSTNTYIGFVSAVGTGSFNITFTSVSGTTSDSPVINFAVIKGSTN
jgi:hypothetical protein